MITYTVAAFTDTDLRTDVTYTDDEGLVHIRTLNIPRNEDGTLDADQWQEILDGQERGVLNKLRLNVIEFQDPADTSSETEETEEI